ncbi:MDR permease [Streptococcus criceti]|uniref:Membrane protein n=1 Tax=Streptococcus criceti HS-6 TaxID=873449 RepID=G5JN76_STRCG|nr:MFS transporter [Streptococcus criceti]EHI75457.1 putative membrane protein [Streptococcus criceti HS-6]SUN41627.1 MDR permease [Streptococcus criceti]
MTKLKKILLTLAMCLGVFLVMLDTTIMNITIPAIQKSFNIGLDRLSWAINIYTIIFASFTIPLSKLADIYGKGHFFALGLCLFGCGSLISGFSAGFNWLLVGRLIASFGAAILLPVGNTLGISTWSIEDRVKVVAALGLTQGGAAAIGPTLGGFLTDSLSWHWIFFINLPFVLFAFLLICFTYHFRNDERILTKIDWIGSLLSMMSLFAASLGIIKIRDWGFWDVKSLACFLVFLIALIIFISLEKRIEHPMINLNLFRFREFSASTFIATVVQFFYVGVLVILPTYFTNVQSKAELGAALILLPMSIIVFIFGGLGSLLINRLGPRILVLIGLGSILLSYGLLVTVNPAKTWEMTAATIILGIGFGTIAGPVNVLAASSLQGELLTSSQSVLGVVRQIGSVLAVSVFISMATNNLKALKLYTPSTMADAYISIYKIWIPFMILMLALTLLFPRRKDYLKGTADKKISKTLSRNKIK